MTTLPPVSQLPITSDLRELYKLSNYHRHFLRDSTECVCFYCLKHFDDKSIQEYDWIDDGNTAICPECGTDSVLPSDFNNPISDDVFRTCIPNITLKVLAQK